MGGKTKKLRIKQRRSKIFAADIVIEAIVLGIGLFEAAIFLLGGLAGELGVWTIVVGAVYFALPYNLILMAPSLFPTMHAWKRLLVVLLCNAPFVVFLGLQGTGQTLLFLLALVLVGLAFSLPKVHFRTIPGIDVLSMAFFVAGPFVYGVLLGGTEGVWWVPAWLAGMMVIAANYLMYKLPTAELEQRIHVDGTDVRLGIDKTVVACLGLYLVAAIIPMVGYGWIGVPAGALLLWYFLAALQAIPYRMFAGSLGLYRVWQIIWWLNYPIGILLLIYAWILIATQT